MDYIISFINGVESEVWNIVVLIQFFINLIVVGLLIRFIVFGNKNKTTETKSYDMIASKSFFTNMSHVLRTPMNVIIGMSEIILKKNIDEETRQDVKKVLGSARELYSVINNLLDLSKLETDRFNLVKEDYELSLLLYDILNIADIYLKGSNVKFNINLAEDIPKGLNGDPLRIKEILLSIIKNAVQNTHNGEIRLNVSCKKNKSDVEIIFEIIDTGDGIHKRDIDKIFEPFNCINKKKVNGAGMSLAISQRLAKLMSGDISVKSKLSKGSVFTVKIKQKVYDNTPCGSIEFEKKSPEEFKQKRSLLGNEFVPGARVLVVDDLKVNLNVLKGLLEYYNIIVDLASNGIDAIEYIKTNTYDMVFMDYMMPELDGAETTDIIRRMDNGRYKDLPIVAVTADDDAEHGKMFFMCNGFSDYLEKPIELNSLNIIIKKWLPMRQTDDVVIKPIENNNIVIEGIDTAEGIKRVGGKVALYQNVLKSYYNENKDSSEVLKEFAKNDLELFKIRIHGIKSSSASIGANEVSEKAKYLEIAAGKKNKSYIELHLYDFIGIFERLLLNIGTYLNSITNAIIKKGDARNKTSVKPDIFVLNELKNAFTNYDLSLMEEYSDKLKSYIYDSNTNVFLEKIFECIDNLDYDTGAALIDSYLEDHK